MKLIPCARPVRIRISSGGMEHSTLDSFKAHFEVSSVMPMIKDGRLVRWLKQCGETEMARNVQSVDVNNEAAILKIFFPELDTCKSKIDLVTKLYLMGQKHDATYLYERYLANDEKAVMKLYRLGISLDLDWGSKLLNLCENSADVSLLYAREAVAGKIESNPRTVKNELENAIRLGSKEAKLFASSKEYKSYLRSIDRFCDIDKSEMESLNIEVLASGVLPNRNNPKEHEILVFVLLCHDISVEIRQNQRYGKGEYVKLSPHDPIFKYGMWEGSLLEPEYTLLYMILKKDIDRSRLEKFRDISVPVRHFLDGRLSNLKLREIIRYIVEYLFDVE